MIMDYAPAGRVLRTAVVARPAPASPGNAVAYLPASFAHQHHSAGLAFVPVSDPSPSEVMVAWPSASRSRVPLAGARPWPGKAR